jgi:hypothetical protein
MGTADNRGFRKGFAGFKGDKNTPAAGNFPPATLHKRFCPGRENLRKFTLWRPWQKGPDRKRRVLEPFMSQFIERYPTAVIWAFAVLQGAAMLGLNVLLRALVS